MDNNSSIRLFEAEILPYLIRQTPIWQEWSSPEGDCLYVSPYCEDISGYQAEEFLKDVTLFERILQPDDQKKFKEFCLSEKQSNSKEVSLRIKHRDGDLRWLKILSCPIRAADGSIVGIYRCIQNISERKRLEHQIIEIQNITQALLNTPYDLSLIVDLEGKILHTGEALSRRTGVSGEAIIGRSLWDFFSPPVVKYRKGWFEYVLKNKQAVRVEDQQTLGEGPPAYYDTWIYPIFGEKEEITQLVIMARDITHIKRTEQELHQSKSQLEVILEGVANGVFVMDKTGTLIYANQTGSQQLFGSIQDLKETPRKIFDGWIILDENGNQFEWNNLPGWAALRGEPSPPVILRYKRQQEDSENWLMLKATPVFDEKKQVQFAVVISDDITELKLTQLELELAHRELADRIDERTVELSQAIQELQQEIAIRKRAEQTAQQNAARAEALARVAARLNAQLGLEAVLNTVCEETARVVESMPSALVSVYLFDPEEDALINFATYSKTGRIPKNSPAIPRKIYDQWLETYGPIITALYKTDLAFIDQLDCPTDFPITSCLSISMWQEATLIGSLDLVSLDEAQLPSEHELALIQAIANQAATAIVNAQLFEEVSIARNQLQQISRRLVEIQEQERRYLARELHDEIGGLLTSLRINLDLAARTPDVVQTSPLTQAQELTDQLIKLIREISLDLRPTILDDLGLLPALLAYFEQYSKRTKISVDFKHHGIEKRFETQIETTAFRAIQEALTNIARHANTNQAIVRIWANDELLEVQIRDEGKGFDLQQIELMGNSSGLSGIQERVKMCQGMLEIEAIPGQGTCLTAELPLDELQRGIEKNDIDFTRR